MPSVEFILPQQEGIMFNFISLFLQIATSFSPPLPAQIPDWSAPGSITSNQTVIKTAGWTRFVPSQDTIAIYVSSSIGDDANNGRWPGPPGYIVGTGHYPNGYTVPQGVGNGPKRTIGAATLLLRDGYPDWLLLMKGDTFNGTFGDTSPIHGYWILHGRSAIERMVISSYGRAGAPRPIVNSGWGNCFTTWNQIWQGHWADNIAIVSLEFTCNPDNSAGQRGTNRGIQIFGASNNFVIEDCKISKFETNIVLFGIQNAILTNTVVRRNVIVDAYNTANTNSQGLYASTESGLLIEENVFDHNGWLDNQNPPPPNPNWFRHNIYLQNLSDLPVDHINPIVRGNIIVGTDGIQQRPGGVCDNNLFMANGINLQFGSGNTPEPAGVFGEVIGNVILGGNDFYWHDANNSRGWGLNLGNMINTLVSLNIVAHNAIPADGIPGGTSPIAWDLNFDNGHGNPAGMQNDLFEDNIIYDWPINFFPQFNGSDGLIHFYGNSNIVSNLIFNNNEFQDVVATHQQQVLMTLRGFSPNGPLTSQIHSMNNKWFRNVNGDGPMSGQTFDNVGNYRTFTQFMSDCGDTTSTWTTGTYPDPNRTIGSWHLFIGKGIHRINPDGTLLTYMRDCRLQSRDLWDIRLMPTYNGVVDNGPIKYIRVGFGK